jgi:cytochrome c biogenesis protein CcmG/thiol:disulfide interchange protein DsbE
MAESGPFGIKPFWWLGGGCLAALVCLVAGVTGASLGWAVYGPGSDGGQVAEQSTQPVRDAPIQPLRGNPIGQRAPDFTLLALDGTSYTLSDIHDRPVLINFWATWCGPCRTEMPVIEAAYQAHRAEGLIVLGIDVEENPEVAEAFAGWLGITFPVLDDGTGEVMRRYRVTALPTSFFVDVDGVIRAWQVGAVTEAALDRHLATILR